MVNSRLIGTLSPHRPTVNYDECTFYLDTFSIIAWAFYLAKKARNGDEDAIEVLISAQIVISDVKGEHYFNYRDYQE